MSEPKSTTKEQSRKAGGSRCIPLWLRALAVGLGTLVLLLGSLAVLPVVSPSASAAIADELRTILGPQFVAELESFSFQLQDVANQLRYQAGGQKPSVSWANTYPSPTRPTTLPDQSVSPSEPSSEPNAVSAPATPTPDSGPASEEDLRGSRHQGANSLPSELATPIPPPAIPLHAVPPITAWESFGSWPLSSAALSRASVQPDPYRPYAWAALVRIDLTKTTLHVAPGTIEPIASSGVPPFPRPGTIPPDEQNGNLLAAFNGGFKAINGHYGMMAGGVTLIPPRAGLATVALYGDGGVRIGDWGRDLTLTPDMVAYRQNCPLLIDAGVLNPAIRNENRAEWGYTVKNLDTTWRSGLGLTRDGHYLIYAVGYSLTVESLSVALQAAGAYYAMQLDINGYFTRFVTFRAVNKSSIVADRLLVQMDASPSQFLTPYPRDFFYVLARG